MSEPLDPITLKRLAYTEAAKKHVRMVDMPAVAQDIRLGTLHPRCRPLSTTDRPMQGADPVVSLATPRRALSMNSLSLGDIGRIQAIVCDVFDVPPGSMRGKRRDRKNVLARQAAMSLAFKILSGESKAGIGRAFLHDHTTVMWAITACEDRLLSNHPAFADFAARYRDAEAKARAALGLADG